MGPINPEKTEILLLYPKVVKDKIVIQGTMVDGQCIRYSKVVKNVGVHLDEQLNLDVHVNKVVSHCYKLLKDIGKIRNVISNNHTEMLGHAVISSRLDYCNSMFFIIIIIFRSTGFLFGMKSLPGPSYQSPLDFDQKLAKFKESFPRKVRKTHILTGFRGFSANRIFFSEIRLCHFVYHIDSQLHDKN